MATKFETLDHFLALSFGSRATTTDPNAIENLQVRVKKIKDESGVNVADDDDFLLFVAFPEDPSNTWELQPGKPSAATPSPPTPTPETAWSGKAPQNYTPTWRNRDPRGFFATWKPNELAVGSEFIWTIPYTVAASAAGKSKKINAVALSHLKAADGTVGTIWSTVKILDVDIPAAPVKLTIDPPGPTLPPGTVGKEYELQFTTNVTGGVSFIIDGALLPDGLKQQSGDGSGQVKIKGT